MRNYLIILLCLFSITLSAQVEQYNVLNVAGQIKVKGSGKLLAKGDVISSEDQVVFMTASSMAAVFSPSKGRFTLKPKPDQKTGGEFYAFVKLSIVPQTQTLSTRAGETPGLVSPDADNELCGKEVLILGNTYLPLKAESYPVDANHFFYLKLDWNGQMVQKKLLTEDGKLFLNAADILMVDGQKVMSDEMSGFKLYHFDSQAKASVLVCAFTPLFVDEEALLEEAAIIVEADRNAGFDEERVRDDVRNYFHDYYGRTLTASFNDWFSRHFAK
jgi:hypothetical protein